MIEQEYDIMLGYKNNGKYDYNSNYPFICTVLFRIYCHSFYQKSQLYSPCLDYQSTVLWSKEPVYINRINLTTLINQQR